MPKKDDQGSYELVDSQCFGKDLKSNVSSSADDIFPQSADPSDANFLRNKFDTIAGSTRSKFSFKGIKRRKYLIIILVLAVLIIAGSITYTTQNGFDVLDYYKSKISSDNKSPEVQNDQESTVVYDDNDEPLKDEAAKQQEQNQASKHQAEKPQEDSEPVHNGNDEPLKEEDRTKESSGKNDVEDTSSQDSDKVEDASKEPARKSKKRAKITMDAIRAGKFYVYDTDLTFITPPAGATNFVDEGLYYARSHNNIVVLKGIDNAFSQVLLPMMEFEYNEEKHSVSKVYPNYDLTHVLVSTESEMVYRHSSNAYYWIYDVEKKSFSPLVTGEKDTLVKSSFANWSPKYNFITFVQGNDIYTKDIKTGDLNRITTDGSATIFNGKTDWVYEEEVLADDKALWWSPDEAHLIFMRTDEADVPKYNIDYYVKNSDTGSKYPVSKEISYPKPGYKNPKVSMKVYKLKTGEVTELDRSDSKLGSDYIIYEALFIDEGNFLIKETDRESNIMNVRQYNPNSGEGKIIYKVDAVKDYKGWIEKFSSPIPIPPIGSSKTWGYVDTMVVKGYNHLVYFETATTETPKILTSGEWEVLNSPLAYNTETSVVYFAANKRSSVDKHIYTIKLDTAELADFTENLEQAYYDAKFSPNAKYVALNYEGPGTPEQKLLKSLDKFEVRQLSVATYAEISKNIYDFPTKTFHKVKAENDEVELNVVEFLPPNFDKSKKYPLLVHFYGGPGSQVVNSKYDVWFQDVVSSSLDAVVLYIEPRGTGGQGWDYRSWSRNKIGYWEPRDITYVTKQWLKKGFINPEQTALWGWSYGGFTTLKTLEYDAGETFKYGMAVAPVTNWLFYDSIYTERYMDKPENNKEGYDISQISNMENLAKAKRFLVMHGTADDNVHIQNTYTLLDNLDMKGVENYDVHVFPDSDHSIYYHNANVIVYDKLFSWLKDAFQGDYEKIGL